VAERLNSSRVGRKKNDENRAAAGIACGNFRTAVPSILNNAASLIFTRREHEFGWLSAILIGTPFNSTPLYRKLRVASSSSV
jgi:hypothetical protein